MSLLYCCVSGKYFNEIYDGINFYKFLNNDLKHYGMIYKEGLNKDILPFTPTRDCTKGGLYFCEESCCYLFWQRYGTKLAVIKIPDDAKVYVERDKFKSDKIIIEHIIEFKNVRDSFWVNILWKNGLALQYIKQQTLELCVIGINQNIDALQYINSEFQTYAFARTAVQINGQALKYITNQTEDLCILAVQHFGKALVYVKTQTMQICMEAIQQNYSALEHVNKEFKTDELLKHVVQNNGLSLKYINFSDQTEEICNLAVNQNGLAIEYVSPQFKTEELCILAVNQYQLMTQKNLN